MQERRNLYLVILMGLFLVIGCSRENPPEPQRQDQEQEQDQIKPPPSEPNGPIDPLGPPTDEIGEFPADELDNIPSLIPTVYHIASEPDTDCIGEYDRNYYDNPEKTKELLTPKGEVIAYVCRRFAAKLAMEGTGVLTAENGGVTLNWAGNFRYNVMDKCSFGEGVRYELCLLPFHTIAADLVSHHIGDIIFIPKIQQLKLKLPDGSLHSGLFEVRDTGDAFQGAGPRRIDLFVSTQTDEDNVFSNAGVHRPATFKAFKLKGESKARAIKFFQYKFDKLY